MLNLGIIGFGKMGEIRAKAFERTQNCKVHKIYDPFLQQKTPYIKATYLEEILDDPSIDLIILSGPNSLNFSTTIRALKKRKHIFCEKPPCFTVEEMKKIRAEESTSSKKLMYGFNHRHHQAIQKMKTLIDSESYGKVLWMRGRYGKSVDESYLTSWRSQKEEAGGGILLDQGIHMLDLFLYLGGNFNEVKAFVSNLYWKLEGIEDNVFAIMKNSKTGCVASLHSTMTQWRHLFSLEIFLERGYLVLNGLKTSSGTYGKEELTIAKNRSQAPAATWEDEEKITYETDDSWYEEAKHCVDSILNNTPVEIGNSNDALKVMEIIEKIYQNERQEADELYTSLKAYPKEQRGSYEKRL
jgi:1,5-anhydro-D-fructose reductase (1,5-anhydro-D-mannitol-forming)